VRNPTPTRTRCDCYSKLAFRNEYSALG
jgi:hypothetical protein